MNASPSLDSRVLQFAGLGLLALAAVFGWQELELQGVLIAVVASGIATIISAQKLEGAIHSVRVAHCGLIKPAELKLVGAEFRLH